MNYHIRSTALSVSLITSLLPLLSGCSPKGSLPKHESVVRALTEKRYEAAISKLDTLIAHQPDSTQHYMLRGYAQDELQNYEAGIADFTAAIQIDSSSAIAYNNRGYAYYLSNQFKLAEQDYTCAIQLTPSFSPAFGNRALLYVATSKYQQAIQDVDCALALGDTTNSTYYNLKGYSELQLGYPSLAIRTLSCALRLDSAYRDAATHQRDARKALTDSINNQRVNR
ncbi:tetratricopeptide repeat protein [Hymenobacter sp. 102]|uniref:tetratricopeptide repeat protein n=1 Tax=Hymenobacter sp. 102 TaxID=3403152 RepID=UPI003CEE8A57